MSLLSKGRATHSSERETMGRGGMASRGQSGNGHTAGIWAARQSGEQVICRSECPGI